MATKLKVLLMIFLSCFLCAGVFANETLKKIPTDDELEYTLRRLRLKVTAHCTHCKWK